METGSVISDLAVVIVSAAVVTILFKMLRLPVMLGYLLSGLIVGPHFLSSPLVEDIHIINELSELGVAFLMFYIGLEFDLRKLQRIMGPAFLAVALQTVLMVFVGILAAPLMGWSGMNGLFLGCILAISSTMITLPILRGQDALKANFAQAAIGMLILEDILAILVLVVLSGVGVTGKFQWDQAWKVTFFVGVFVVMVFVAGKLMAPKLLRLLRKFGNPEMVTVVAVALLLGIGELADAFDFSIALGAFLAGSILSQSELAHEIELAIEPLKNMFTAVFFVTVGMRIEPGLLAEYWVSVFWLTLLVVVGKTLTVWIGMFLTGQKSSTAFKAALCKAQIGEFSFVIAALGASYAITEDGMMTLAVGVSLGTIFVVPFLSDNAMKIYNWVGGKMPSGVKYTGEFYTSFLGAVREQVSKSAFLMLVKRPLMQILLYFLLFNGIIIVAYLAVSYAHNYPKLTQPYEDWVRYGIWVVTALLCLPFLIAIIRSLEVIVLLITESAFSLKANKVFRRGRMRNIMNTGILCFAIVFLGGIYLSAAATFLPSGVALLAFVGLVVLLSFFFWRHIVRVNSRLEQLFMESFNFEVKTADEQKRESALKAFAKKHPWKVKLSDVELKAGMAVVGKCINELNLREKTGVSIIGIARGNYTVYDPSPETPLFPGDHIIILGSDEESKKARKLLGKSLKKEEVEALAEGGKFEIENIYLPSRAPIVGNTISDANIRRKHRLSVIGIQRGDKRISSPLPDEIIKAEDILVVVGIKKTILRFREAMGLVVEE